MYSETFRKLKQFAAQNPDDFETVTEKELDSAIMPVKKAARNITQFHSSCPSTAHYEANPNRL